MNELELIKNSFEKWYNTTQPKDKNVSIAINYSDEQTLVIKAYHKVTITMMAIGIRDNLSYTLPLLSVTQNYNHGVTSEEEAKETITTHFLSKLFLYCAGKGKSN